MAKYRLPVLHYLLAFEAAARHQSIKRAADELHVTHSAVSRNLQKLERQLGHPLFERRHRRIVPTSEGELLRGAVDSGFSYIHHVIQQIIMSRSPQRLIISVDPDFASLWLVPRLADFYKMVPNMLVEIRAEKGAESSEDSRCHCAIHYSEVGTTPANGEVLFRSRLFPVCAPALRETTQLAGPEDLCRQVLLFDRSKVEWQQYFRGVGIKADLGPGLVFNTTAMCMDAAVRGQGVAMGDDFLADQYLSEGRLVKPFDSGFLSRNAYYFIASKSAAGHPAVSVFRDWLLRSISRARASPPGR